MGVLSDQLTQTLNSSVTDIINRQSGADKNAAELGRDDFLKLLVAQLTYQDPLDPMDDKDFTAQLAQFSSLDQLIKIADGVDLMNTNSTQQNLLNSSSFIGKEIRASGQSLTIKEGSVENTLYVNMAEDIASGVVTIYSSTGDIVWSEKVGAKSADEVFKYEWNGKGYNGAVQPDGVYYVTMKAENANGENVLLATEISGVVEGVQLINGTQYFRLEDGRNVRLEDVIEVINTKTGSNSNKDPESTEEP